MRGVVRVAGIRVHNIGETIRPNRDLEEVEQLTTWSAANNRKRRTEDPDITNRTLVRDVVAGLCDGEHGFAISRIQ